MNILGLDTSSAVSATCLLRADGAAFEHRPDPARLGEPPAHSRDLLLAVERVRREAEVEWADVGAVAVGVGPGMFTGLRIGVATARALAQARAIPLRAVSSLRALAAGIDAPLALPLVDARRGELFAALYEGDRELWPPFAAPLETIVERLTRDRLQPRAAGDGSLRSMDALKVAGVEVAPGDSPQHVVRALHLCRLAVGSPDASPEAVMPLYLREPDARPLP